MIVTECLFDEVCDLKAVEPFGFVDMKESFVNNCVPSQVGESDADYNGIQDPGSILGTPSDVFDALRMAQDMDKYQKSEGEYNKETD